jgi:L-aspartate oxidase
LDGNEVNTDFLVVGSGIAGLSFAIKAAKFGRVTIITKRASRDSATYYAQGGIASVFGADDSFDSHIKDTLQVGSGLSDPLVVEAAVKDGPLRIQELMELGAQFTGELKNGSMEFDLGKEGGHSERRIIHTEDFTGKEVEETLLLAVEASPNITIYEEHIVVDLITHSKFIGTPDDDVVWGAYVLDKQTGEIKTMLAHATILATGGVGKVYLYTSNPDVSTGDGIAAAYRAGAKIANMEFIQFHPTCLYHSKAKSFLLSEALRGEGATLKLKNGNSFMKAYHEKAELAPRDIVARAIDFELKKSGDDCVYLDISHRGSEFIKKRFPNLYEKCLEFGYDMTKGPVPVVPAAHYICGGIKTDLTGQSTLRRLFAIGETASTGLHGANRLASNSLLECLVFAHRAAKRVGEIFKDSKESIPPIPPWETRGAVRSDEAVVISHDWDEIRRLMWNCVGIVRSDKRLDMGRRRIEHIRREIEQYYWDFTVTSDLLELRNLATVAWIIIRSARLRKESRGLHFNIDYPNVDDEHFKKDTILSIR